MSVIVQSSKFTESGSPFSFEETLPISVCSLYDSDVSSLLTHVSILVDLLRILVLGSHPHRLLLVDDWLLVDDRLNQLLSWIGNLIDRCI